jgi:hypothetical protein
VLVSPLRAIDNTAQRRPSTSDDSRAKADESESDDTRAYNSLARSSAHSRPTAIRRNHLEDILSPQESWLDIVEDVDQALGRIDTHHAVFAELGV